MQKVSPCLWFDTQAEQAVNFYVATFKNSAISSINYYQEGAPMPKGTVMTVGFTIDGQEFLALNGGPHFTFTPAVSFIVYCEDQAEVDDLWDKLTAKGTPQQCGWVTDQFGLTWQIVPKQLPVLLSSSDTAAAQRAAAAMMKMVKLDIAQMQRAFDNL